MRYQQCGTGTHPAKRIRALEYGQTIRIPKREWRSFIPVVDDLQIMLDRPDIERAPLDWVRFWLNGPLDDDFTGVKDGPYVVDECAITGDLIVTLPARHCPRCRGAGRYVELPIIVRPRSINGYADASETIEIKWVNCDHKNDYVS